MQVWQFAPEAQGVPLRVIPGEKAVVWIGTWPIESGQSIWLSYTVECAGVLIEEGRADAAWKYNLGENSYWCATLGPFKSGEWIAYQIKGSCPSGDVVGPNNGFQVSPLVHLAILWHQHQPVYKDTSYPQQNGSYLHPWVRLHAIRDYYSMAAMLGKYPGVHLTINLTPSLLWQIEDYVAQGATDRALELTLKPAERLTREEREQVLSSFFDAHWHNQIFVHPRYKELFEQRQSGIVFSDQDLRDLQMWFNLAWFAKEFRENDVELITGEAIAVWRFVQKNRGFTVQDIHEVVKCQYKIMEAVIPIHRHLQATGQVEISTTPFFHPILPLIVDTDKATIDRANSTYPQRFSYPEDADAQVQMAISAYNRWFDRSPRGMWPAEGAVGESIVPHFSKHGLQWIASDQGVLARSGKYGYQADDPDVRCQPYRVGDEPSALSIFFRDARLSDEIGFHYSYYADYRHAANEFLNQIRELAARFEGKSDRVVTVILDGENAWGEYREDARPFLHALYKLLESDRAIQTVTFSEYLSGNRENLVAPHPLRQLERVHDLYLGSWIDENSSAPGADLGTWIGEAEENLGWDLLSRARKAVGESGMTPAEYPNIFQSLYMAEGSDWFWWFGEDQDSGNDDEFDDLFRSHLKSVYQGLGKTIPSEVERHIVPHAVTWTFANQVKHIQPQDRLTVRTNCPGTLTWQVDHEEGKSGPLLLAGGVMAGVQRYHITLGPFLHGQKFLRFRFRCTHRDCAGGGLCCIEQTFEIRIVG